jgi:inositol phosphorylceramide mannosyltransferase catalytic subunit
MIPKRLIHIFSAPPGANPDLPLSCKAAQCNARLLNPDFEYIFFNREKMERFLDIEFPEYREVFNSFRFPIQKFDFFRYLAIYRLGGFYMDLDVFLARSLDSLRDSSCVFPFEELTLSDFLRENHGLDWEVGNYAFGAEPENPFIKAVIDNCVRAQKEPVWGIQMMQGIPSAFQEQFYVPNTTGPGLVTRTLGEQTKLRKTVSVLFPLDVCSEQTWHRFGDYGVHLMQASWRKRDSFLRRRLARLWENRKRERLLRESKILGPLRSGEWLSRFPTMPV